MPTQNGTATIINSTTKIKPGPEQHADPPPTDITRGIVSRCLGHKRQIYASAAASTGLLTVGTIVAWSSTALPSLKSTMTELTLDQESWIGSIVPLAASISGPIFGITIDKYGRKPSMIITALLAIIGWLFITFSNHAIIGIYIGRFICGICVGSFVLVIPIYVSDITEKHLRGTLSTMTQAAAVIGILLSFLIGSIVNWEILAMISTLFPLLFLTFLLSIPESPRYLLGIGHDDEAVVVLCWLRGVRNIDEGIVVELEQIKAGLDDIKREMNSCEELFCSSRVLVPLLVGMVLMILQQATGYNALLYFTVEIFQATQAKDAYLNTIIIGCFLVVFLILSTILMDVVGRKVLLIISATFMAIAHLANGYYLSLAREGNLYLGDKFGWVPLTSILLFFAAYAIGFGPIPWIIMSEILPNHIVGITSSLISCIHFTFAFLIVHNFNKMISTFGIEWTFWFFAIFCLISILFVMFFIPETKLKSLEEIQEFYSKRKLSMIFKDIISNKVRLLGRRRSSEQQQQNVANGGGGGIYRTFENPLYNNQNDDEDIENQTPMPVSNHLHISR